MTVRNRKGRIDAKLHLDHGPRFFDRSNEKEEVCRDTSNVVPSGYFHVAKISRFNHGTKIGLLRTLHFVVLILDHVPKSNIYSLRPEAS